MSNQPKDESSSYEEAQSQADEDPGSPTPNDLLEEVDLDLARTLANYGAVEPDTIEPPVEAPEGSPLGGLSTEDAGALRAQTIALDIDAVKAFLTACRDAGVSYGVRAGAKVPFHGATPGRDFKHVDCSGFVREAIWRATTPHLNIIDGSVRQREEWILAGGFERSSVDEARSLDGVVRIAFLKPQDSPSRIGHVAFVHNASTIESHGGVGPDSRPWNGAGWQAKAFVYVLSRPS
jgi:hypothetical protein